MIDWRAATPEADLAAAARAMTAAMVARGPDDEGVWVDAAAGVALGHRRLAVLDLGDAGHQPMVSADGRFVIDYNGEVYNYRDLGDELRDAGEAIAGGSDTAVVLAACAAWGVRAAATRFIGMFAFALWDREARTMTLVRDRLGIKPLYWARFGHRALFASTLAALTQVEGWPRRIDRGALAAYLRLAYVPAPRTIYEGVAKLAPGHMLVLGPGDAAPEPYWDLAAIAGDGAADPIDIDDDAAVARADALIGDAVGRRMIADVPLGVFLSGGIDSSTVAAHMQARSRRPVRSFSIGFRDPRYDEAPHARAVAEHLGTDHTELYVEPGQVLDLVPDMAGMYDEPFADVSQLPTAMLSQLTRRHVTVALSGDGGDEVFAGYNRYQWAQPLADLRRRLPQAGRGALAMALRLPPPRAWDLAGMLVPAKRRPKMLGDRVHKLAHAIEARDAAHLYRTLISQWPHPERLMPGVAEFDPIAGRDGALDDPVARMQLLDTLTYLPDDILTKVDRASMAFSLEVRVPLLDHRLVEFAWRLPPRLRRRDGAGKWLLRQVLYRYVPRALVERPKMGFAVPLDAWLRGPLRQWAEDLLAPQRLRDGGFFEEAPVRALWKAHLSGRRNHQYALWTVLMFETWRAAQAAS